MVLGKLSVPGCLIRLNNSMARAYCACSGWGGGCLVFFFFRLFFSFLSPSLGYGPIQAHILSQTAVEFKTTNQPPNQSFTAKPL